jgi:hypothetical protein
VPSNLGGLGTSIYIVTLETLRPMEAEHTSCMQLLWKRHNSGSQGTPIYVVTRKLREVGRQGTLIYVVIMEI